MTRHWLATALLLGALPAAAQQGRPAALSDVGFDQKLGAALPLELPLRDESGRDVRLGDYFGKRPVVLSFVYYKCPMLCTLSLNGLASALGVLSFEPGKDFEIVTVSFDPKDTPSDAAAKKKIYLDRYKHAGASEGWHFLTGRGEDLKRLTDATGFRYAWDDLTQQFAHPAGIMVATPEGRLSRYLFGIEYAPRDLRLALVESASEKIGNPSDVVALFCFQYDPARGRYGVAIMRMVRIAGILTVLGLAGAILFMLRHEPGTPAPAGRNG
jgi:protein SCO1/2